MAFYAVAAGLGAVYIPLGWVAGCLCAILVADAIEGRTARALLAAGDDSFERRWRELIVAHLTEASAIALLIAAAWHFAEIGHIAFPLCLSFSVAFVVAMRCRQVYGLMMIRQSVYSALAVAMAGRKLLAAQAVTVEALATDLLPVVAFAGYAVWIGHAMAMTYRRGIEREHELAEARDAAERAQEARAMLIATISHELRTPLNGVIGMAQALLARELPPAVRRQIDVIAESGRNLNALLNDILDYSKLEAGHLAISPAEEDPRRMATSVEELFRPLAEQKGLEFAVHVGEEVPGRLVFDAMRVRQCLANLVSNAMKFTGEGSVTVSVSAVAAEPAPDGRNRWQVTCEVADTGVGIGRDEQKGLFAPYAQADESIARRYGGTGLGLSITRSLAEAMGGDVSLESAPGQGSTFRLRFLAGAVKGEDQDARAGTTRQPLAARRVLVADDTQTNRMVIRLFLEPLGIETVEAEDGAAALSALKRGRYDAALLDLAMPGMDGAELAARIRRGEAGRADLPLVAISGRAEPRAPKGFDGFLAKPIDPRALRAALEAALAARGTTSARPED